MVDQLPPTRSARPALSRASTAWRFAAIGAVVAVFAGAFYYVNGTLDSQRLRPQTFVDALERNNGVHPGYRRNHAKGLCVAGYFDSTGAAQSLSRAQVFEPGRTPVEGRFALPSGNPYAPDSSVPIRSLALRFTQANGQQWRTGMNSMPVFPVGTPEAFYQMLQAGAPDPATGKPKPTAMPAFFAAHPETAAFVQWVKTARPSASFATERYNGINAFYLVNAAGQRQAVRWSMVPEGQDTAGASAPNDTDYLQQEVARRLAAGPLKWQLHLTLAEPGDPTHDASTTWPEGRTVINAGTLVVQSAQEQGTGACRDINYDPLILPEGIEGSDDPLLAARSATYASSYLRRTREVGALTQEHRP